MAKFRSAKYIKRYLRFAWQARAFGAERPDVVICHDTTTALAAYLRAGGKTSRIILDLIETPRLRQRTTNHFRSAPLWLVWSLEAVERWLAKRAGEIFTSSPGFTALVKARYGRQARHIVNYSGPAILSDLKTDILNQFGLPPSTVLVVWPSTFSRLTGAELALDTIAMAPDNWRLIVIGGGKQSERRVKVRLAALGEKVIFLDYADRDRYLELIRSCDVGWVLFTHSFENLRLCVPNRFFDLISVGVPVVTTAHKTLDRCLENLPIGMSIADRNPAALLDASQTMLKNRSVQTPSSADIDSVLGSISMMDALKSVLPKAVSPATYRPKASIVAFRKLTGRNRIVEMLKALDALGYDTDVVCTGDVPRDSMR